MAIRSSLKTDSLVLDCFDDLIVIDRLVEDTYHGWWQTTSSAAKPLPVENRVNQQVEC